VDAATKRLQIICLPVALVSLALTLLLYFHGRAWLFPALTSYALLALLIGYGEKKLRFVRYDRPARNRTRD